MFHLAFKKTIPGYIVIMHTALHKFIIDRMKYVSYLTNVLRINQK